MIQSNIIDYNLFEKFSDCISLSSSSRTCINLDLLSFLKVSLIDLSKLRVFLGSLFGC